MQMYPDFQQSFGYEGMKLFNKYVFLPKFLNDPSLIDVLLPNTIDEIKAEEENDAINSNSMPNVAETDDHRSHLLIHTMAKNTWAKWTHMAWHEELLAQQIKDGQVTIGMPPMNPHIKEIMDYKDLQPDQQSAMAQQAGLPGQQPSQPGQPQQTPGSQKANPLQAAASLRGATATNIQQNQQTK